MNLVRSLIIGIWMSSLAVSTLLAPPKAHAATQDNDDVERAIRVTTDARADSITVGERFHVRYRIAFPDSLTLLPSEGVDGGNCRVLSVDWQDDHDKHERIRTGRLTAVTLDLEGAHLPGLPFLFLTPAGDTVTVFSEEVEVPVQQLVAAEEKDAKPLKPQWVAPRSYFWWYVAGAAVVLAALALWWWFRRPKKLPEAAPRPELPPDFVALQALAEIERMELPEAGEFKRHYTMVTDVLRTYLEKRYEILAMEQTTDEILDAFSRRHTTVDNLEPLLKEADLVKFAKYKPDVQAAKQVLEAAREIVARTAPKMIQREEAPVAAVVGE